MITFIIIAGEIAMKCLSEIGCYPLGIQHAYILLSIGAFELVCEGIGIKVFGKKDGNQD